MGVTLGVGEYLVIAGDRDALLGLTTCNLNPEVVLGDYIGELKNGAGEVSLESGEGVVLDRVAYQDNFPCHPQVLTPHQTGCLKITSFDAR